VGPKELRDRALALKGEVQELRRALHRRPELSWQERETTSFAADYLKALGIRDVKVGCPGHPDVGLTAEIEGRSKRPLLVLRADMDALPVEEQSDKPYRSERAGVMHACGHDAHVAMLLGAAKALWELRADLPGSVRLLFQPAEEVGDGAKRMVEGGAMDGADACFAIHVWQLLPSGQIGLRDGPIFAAADEFRITVKGKGGHAAAPHLAVDPVVASCHIGLALQSITAKEINPVEPKVLTLASISAGNVFNVVPQTAHLRGTVRSLSEATSLFAEERIRNIAESVARAFRCEAEVEYLRHLPPTCNHPEIAGPLRELLAEMELEVRPDAELSLGAEDFSILQKKAPGAMALLGTRNDLKGLDKPHHHPSFDVDDEVLWMGVASHLAFAFGIGERLKAQPSL